MEPMDEERREGTGFAPRNSGLFGDGRGHGPDTRGLDIAALVVIILVIWGPLAAGALS